MNAKNTENLVSAIAKLPESWALTPCVGKENFWSGWSTAKLDRNILIDAIANQRNQNGKPTAWTGFSLIFGPISDGMMAIDFDGEAALAKYLELSGGAPLPETRMWTSGKPGHFQILLRVPEAQWQGMKPVKLELQDSHKLEFRWNQCSTLPPSIHPDTAQPYYWENWDENYDWGEGWEDFVAIAPDWVIDLMRNGGKEPPNTQKPNTQYPKTQKPNTQYPIPNNKQPSEILEQDILPRLDAQEFYGEFLPKLKRVGKTLKGLCPFHQEKTPSFTISPEGKTYHCFGCGAGGGPVQFLHQIGGGSGSPSGKDFVDIVRKLGDRVGVSLPERDRTRSETLNAKPAKLPTNIGEAIDAQLATGSTGSALSIALNNISTSSGIGIREIRQIYAEKFQEQERVDDREDTATDVAQLLASKSARLNIAEILPATLAEPIDRLAKKMNLRAECYLLALLTQCGSLLRADTSTMLHPPTNYRVRPNYFGVMIGESGEGKTPVMTAIILDPMQKLLDKARSDFEGAEAVYEAELASWTENKNKDKGPAPKPPVRKVYYFTKQTGEGITAQAGRLPEQGMLYLCDELASLFKSANQYRGGKGSDEEDLLEYWSGGGATVLRAGGLTVDVRNISLSIFGNIQPKVLAKFVGDGDDNNGKFARFDFIHQPPTITRLSGDSARIDLSPMLTNLYERLDNLSISSFELDKAAHDLFTSFYDECSERKFSHPKQGMRAMLAKASAKVGKLATILHCIKAAHCGVEVSQYISIESVQGAIKFVRHTIDQALSTEAELTANSLAPNLMKVLEVAKRKGGTVSVRDVQRSFSSKQQPISPQVQEWFRELVAMQYGESRIVGKSSQFTLKTAPTALTMTSNPCRERAEVADSNADIPLTPADNYPTQFNQVSALSALSADVSDDCRRLNTLPDMHLTPIVSTVSDNLVKFTSQLQTAQTWAECEAVWGNDSELKAQIKAVLTREELARIGKLFKAAQQPQPISIASEPEPETISPEDAEKIRNIAVIWWDEFYPENLQSLIVQMFGRGAPGTKYSSEAIARWLETEDELVRDRIHRLFDLKNNSTEQTT